jgi:hypothetical protein
MSDLRKIAQDLAEIQQEVNMVSKKAAYPSYRRKRALEVDAESWNVFLKKIPTGFQPSYGGRFDALAFGEAVKVTDNSVLKIELKIRVSPTEKNELHFQFFLKLESQHDRTHDIPIAEFVVDEISPEIMAEAMDDLILEANKVLKDFPI